MTPEASRIFLVRHGETEWSRTGRHTGRTDVPLTETGRAQAARLAGVLAAQPFDLVLTSPLQRAVETARLAGMAAQAHTDTDLREWDYGDYEGITTDAIRQSVPGWTVWSDPCPNGESAAQVGRRADAVLDRCRAAGGAVLLVAHGHLLRVLAARWLGLPPTEGRLLLLEPATLSELGHEREVPVLARWNAPPG